MTSLFSIYHDDVPPVILQAAQTDALRRIDHVGMNCGCEYTHMHTWAGIQPYSRLEHSIGVALIVWHFTHDMRQAVAGLLHDIATPAFAHVIDFLNGDHLMQTSTESRTRNIIEQDAQLCSLLHRHGLHIDDVADYHLYPIADNDTPRLSADRMEYTLGNIVNYGFADTDTVARIYDHLCVTTAEDGQPELAFSDGDEACLFGSLMLRCAAIYVSDADRYAMQRLSMLIARAIERGVLAYNDLWQTEPDVIRLLLSDPVTAQGWNDFCSIRRVICTDNRPAEGIWLRVNAKRRYINPLVCIGHQTCRLTDIDAAFKQQLEDFTHQSFDYLIGEPVT